MDLNRDDLSSDRAKAFHKLQRHVDRLRNANADPQTIENTILEFADKNEEYSGMFKYFYQNNMI